MHGWRVYAPFVRGSGASAAKSGQQGNAASSRSIPAMRGNHEDADDAGDSHVYQRIQAIDRAIALLKAIADSAAPLTALELGRACGINRSTAWRVLHTLEHHGLVDRDAATQRYTVGYGAIAIAGAVDSDALVRRARPMLEDLAARTGEATDLTVMKRFSLMPLDQVDAPKAMTPSWLGKTLPLHATSSGKVFLAWMTAEERAAVLPERTRARGCSPRDRAPADPRPRRRVPLAARSATSYGSRRAPARPSASRTRPGPWRRAGRGRSGRRGRVACGLV